MTSSLSLLLLSQLAFLLRQGVLAFGEAKVCQVESAGSDGDVASLLSTAKHVQVHPNVEANKAVKAKMKLEARAGYLQTSELTSTANMVCSEFPRPAIAVCITGAVRTFVRPLLHRSIRTYLVESIGGDTDVFLYLKTQDMRGDSQEEFGATMETAKDAELQAAIEALRPVDYKIERQKIYYPANPKVKLPNLVAEGNKTHFLQAVLGNLHNCRECWQMILKREDALGYNYGFVIRTRPDVSWYLPAQPYCFWSAYAAKPGQPDMNKLFTTRDWVFFMNREVAAKYMDGILRRYETCQNCVYTQRIEEELIPFMLAELGVVIQEDTQQACMLVRPVEKHFPNNMCDQQFRQNLLSLNTISDKVDISFCAKVTYRNKHNK